MITSSDAIKAILKTFYIDKVENLLYRNSPVLKKIGKTRVEGKEQRFAAVSSRGGAVGGQATLAAAKAATSGSNVEFIVTPGQLFSFWTYNAKEVQASLTKKGAYMKVAGNKAFWATEAFRKSLAASLYGRGYGEIGTIDNSSGLTFSEGVAADIVLPEDVLIKIDVDSDIVLKTTVSGAPLVTLTVNSVDDSTGTVNVTPKGNMTAQSEAYLVVALAGSRDASGNPLLPMGLAGWLPAVNGRSGAAWQSYIGTSFYGVTRSVAPDRLAGQFYVAPTNEAKKDTVTALLRKCRRAGGVPDMIIMNDIDWYDLAKSIETTNTLFTQTSEKGKKKATMGFSDFAAAFSTNWIDNVYDDPYCPKGQFFILDSAAVEYLQYTNSEVVKDGVADNDPGKESPLDFNDKGTENESFKLLIDDYLSVVPGALSDDGESVRASINYFGSLAVYNPSNCGTGIFSDATTSALVSYLA